MYVQELLQKLTFFFFPKTLATIETGFSACWATDVYLRRVSVSHDTNTGAQSAAGKCQTWEALGKVGTQVAPGFVRSLSPLSNVAFATASLKHTSHFSWDGTALLRFLGDAWLGRLRSPFSLFHFSQAQGATMPLMRCKRGKCSTPQMFEEQSRPSPLVFRLCHCALIQGGSCCAAWMLTSGAREQ